MKPIARLAAQTAIRPPSAAALAASMAIVCCGLACAGPTTRVSPPDLDPPTRLRLEQWMAAHALPPDSFVLDLFRDHDVVFAGEVHGVRHDLLLVQALLPRLHRAGVRVLATEFGRREDQPLIDSLLRASSWDEALARRIVFQQFVEWGYQEYVDVYRAAWSLNRRLGPGERPFRIIGMNDSPDWSLIRTQADRDDDAIKRQVWRGGGEHLWAATILEAVGRGEKVFVHCGMHHAFTRYKQPIVIQGAFVRFDSTRAGNHVARALGDRVATVVLHAPWPGAGGYDSPRVHPADGAIDALMLGRRGGPVPVGFRLRGTPLGALRPRNAVYRHGYPDFALEDFCDGWIYTRPISRYEPVTAIDGWIQAANLEQARAQSPDPAMRTAGAAQLNARIVKGAGAAGRWARELE